jgi:cell division protein FtsB
VGTTARRSATRQRRRSAVLARRVAIGVGLAGVLFFALEGGEYGTRDLRSRTSRRERLQAEVDVLQAQVESLSAELQRIETDPVTLERIAREEYGMVRGSRELLYRFAEPDDGPEPPR